MLKVTQLQHKLAQLRVIYPQCCHRAPTAQRCDALVSSMNHRGSFPRWYEYPAAAGILADARADNPRHVRASARVACEALRHYLSPKDDPATRSFAFNYVFS